jgi:hypothetical protein
MTRCWHMFLRASFWSARIDDELELHKNFNKNASSVETRSAFWVSWKMGLLVAAGGICWSCSRMIHSATPAECSSTCPALFEVPLSSSFSQVVLRRFPGTRRHFTWEWLKPRCGDIMDAAIIYPLYRLTPGPHVSPHSCFSLLRREQLSCLRNVGFEACGLLLYLVIFVKSQERRSSCQCAVVA